MDQNCNFQRDGPGGGGGGSNPKSLWVGYGNFLAQHVNLLFCKIIRFLKQKIYPSLKHVYYTAIYSNTYSVCHN